MSTTDVKSQYKPNGSNQQFYHEAEIYGMVCTEKYEVGDRRSTTKEGKNKSSQVPAKRVQMASIPCYGTRCSISLCETPIHNELDKRNLTLSYQ